MSFIWLRDFRSCPAPPRDSDCFSHLQARRQARFHLPKRALVFVILGFRGSCLWAADFSWLLFLPLELERTPRFPPLGLSHHLLGYQSGPHFKPGPPPEVQISQDFPTIQGCSKIPSPQRAGVRLCRPLTNLRKPLQSHDMGGWGGSGPVPAPVVLAASWDLLSHIQRGGWRAWGSDTWELRTVPGRRWDGWGWGGLPPCPAESRAVGWKLLAVTKERTSQWVCDVFRSLEPQAHGTCS